VYSPPGNLIGVISYAAIQTRYKIIDAMLPDAPLFNIKGPFFTINCICGDVDFPIFETGIKGEDGKIGLISKQWGGILKEFLTDLDSFGVNFPLDLEAKHKALFLAACFLIVSYTLISFYFLTISFIHLQDRKHFSRTSFRR